MLMILSREVIGLEIKMLSIICVEPLHKLFMSYSHMDYHSLELKKVKFIKDHLEVNH